MDQEQAELRMKLASLEIEHEDYSRAIDALVETRANTLTIQRFKKRKLTLKDQISKLHAELLPDIIA